MPELKPLFGPNCHLFLGRRLDLGSEPAVMVEKSRKVHGMAEAKRMADRSSQLMRLAIKPQGLVRVAKVPQSQREIATVGHAGVMARMGGPETGTLTVVVGGQRLLVANSGIRELGTVEHRGAQHEQRFHQNAVVVQTLGERPPVGSEANARTQIAAHEVPLPLAQHDSEQLGLIPNPLA